MVRMENLLCSMHDSYHLYHASIGDDNLSGA